MNFLLRKFGRSVLSRFTKHERGVTAIEFALVFPPFFYLLGATFETGLMLFSEYTLDNATAETGRLIRTGQVQNAGMSAADFKSQICSQVLLSNCGSKLYVDVRKYDSFADVTSPSAISTDEDGNKEVSEDVSTNSQFQTGGPGDVVVVRVYYEWELLMPQIPGLDSFANLSGNRRLLKSSFAFKNEPYSED